MTGLKDYGGLLMGSRLKRLSEALYAGVDEVYREHRVELSSRCFPILFLLRDNGPLAITDLAGRLGQSHPAVSQMSRKLLAEGLVAEREDPADERRRLLALSRKGRALMDRMGPVWKAVERAMDELAGPAFHAAVQQGEDALEMRGFAQRIREAHRLNRGGEVAVIPFEPRYREDFKRLNVEWLEKHFYVEAIDNEVLSQPERMILAPGGHIFLARLGGGAGETGEGEIVGTCALIKTPDGFELSKMAVTERYQGLRIGHRLLQAAIAAFRQTGAARLFLESNSKLKTAIRLYERNGFEHAARPEPSHYVRADVYMVYRGPDA